MAYGHANVKFVPKEGPLCKLTALKNLIACSGLLNKNDTKPPYPPSSFLI